MSHKALGREELENLIVDFMESQGMCVMATCSGNVPRASAVEFFPEGTTIYVLTEGDRKVENVEKNPRVSVAIHTQFTGWDTIKGVQITGRAEIGGRGSATFAEGERAYERRKKQAIRLPDFMHVIRITPQQIEYLDTTLRAKGYDARHVLEYPPAAGSCFSG
ncbi:MAG: pyridoxamine 5'-phosphate oxidase family protein [Betaproteobacteria bacterium]